MWRQTSKNIITGSAAPVSGDVEKPKFFELQHTGQPPSPEVVEALRVVVKSGLLKKVDAPLFLLETETQAMAMDEDFRGKMTRIMDELKELNYKASSMQQAKLVYIAHTLLKMETYFLERPKDNSTLIAMLKALRPECEKPPQVNNGADTTKYDAKSHMGEIQLCFKQQLDETSVKSNHVCDDFKFPMVTAGDFSFAQAESVQLLAQQLRTHAYDGLNEKIDKFYQKFSEMIPIILKSITRQETVQQDSPEPNGPNPDGKEPEPETPRQPTPEPDGLSPPVANTPADVTKTQLRQCAVVCAPVPAPRASVMKLTTPSKVSTSW